MATSSRAMGGRPRSQDTDSGSLYADKAYVRISRGYSRGFLVNVSQLVDLMSTGSEWQPFAEPGTPPFETQGLLKTLFLSYLCNVSEWSTEEYVDANVLAKWLMGLAIDEPVPDDFVLRVYRRRLKQERGQNAL